MNTDPLDREKTMEVPPSDKSGYSLAAGQTLGQYRILRPLGRGGMGEVYEVEHQVLRRIYALKLLPVNFASQAGALERFQREAQVMAHLEHPHILRVDDFGETNGRYWLRMERVEGANLKGPATGKKLGPSLQELAEAHGGRLPQEMILHIMRQVLAGLEYAHARGVIHRDLKPGNILLEQNTDPAEVFSCIVKIADFGLVRLVGEEWVRSQAQTSVQQSMSLGEAKTLRDGHEGTSTHALLGTYEYMSPEQKQGGDASVQSDLYSVGLMAFKLLTGRNPGAKPPSRIDPALVRAWDPLVEQALEEDSARRFSDAASMQKALDAVEAELAGARKPSPQSDGGTTGVKPEPQNRGRPIQVAPPPPDSLPRQERKETTKTQATSSSPPGMNRFVRVFLSCLAIFMVAASGVVWWFFDSPDEPKSAEAKQHQRSCPDLKSPWSNSLGMEFLPVPGTEVLFCKWETRVKDYEAFIREKPREWPKPDFEQGPTHPAVNVTWNDANDFCEWLTMKERAAGRIGPKQEYRLPKDWEWSVAVGLNETQGGTPESKDEKIGNVYPWNQGRGTWPPPRAAGNYYSSLGVDNFDRTSPVGTFAANANGLYDLGGNVWELCEDYYDGQSGSRVLRGGSWFDFASRFLLSSYRGSNPPEYRIVNFGFRVVLAGSSF